MKRILIVFGVLGVLFGGYVVASHLSGGALPLPFDVGLGGSQGELRRTTLSFWEDVQFKKFDKATSYHSPEDQDRVDIPYLVRRIFRQPPETIDFKDYEILWVDLDSSGLAARVRSRVKVEHLGAGKILKQDMLLYYFRATKESPWYMKFEDSLYPPKPDKSKVH